MSDTPPPPVPAALDLPFVHRTYRTAGILAVLGAVFLWEALGPRAALGWLCGSGLSLLALAATEWTVRRAVESQKQSTVLIGFLFKVPAIFAAMVLLFFAAQRGWINLIWVLAGFAMPHFVLVLKLVGRKILEFYRMDPEPKSGGAAERGSGRVEERER